MTTKVREISDTDAAMKIMAELSVEHEEVAVYVHREYGFPTTYAIIIDANGHAEQARITKMVYLDLLARSIIGRNTLIPAGGDLYHDFE
jgi:hypothetical protein